MFQVGMGEEPWPSTLVKYFLESHSFKYREFLQIWKNITYWKNYPKFREFLQIWGNFVRKKQVFPNNLHSKCLVYIWKYNKIFSSYWGTSMNYYSISRTLLPSQKQDWKIAISPNLEDFSNFEICNFSKFGEILQILVSPE